MDEMKKLIAQDMKVPEEAIIVNYKISNTSPDWAYNANSYNVTQIEVVVDETKVNP